MQKIKKFKDEYKLLFTKTLYTFTKIKYNSMKEDKNSVFK